MASVVAQGSAGFDTVTLEEHLQGIPEEAFAAPSDSPPTSEDEEFLSTPAEEPFVSHSPASLDVIPVERARAWDSVSSFFEDAFSIFGPPAPGSRERATLTFGLRGGYDDNVFTTNIDQEGSAFSSVFGSLDYSLGTERLKLSVQLSGGVTYFDNREPDPTDYNGAGSIRLEYRPSRRLMINAMASVQYLSQPDPTLIGNISRFSGDYTVANLGFDVSYNIRPRWSVTLGYTFLGLEYADEAANQSLGFYDQNFSLSLTYLVSPKASVVAEYRYNPLTYYETDEGSDGHLMLFGFDYSISPRAIWTLRGGGEARSIREPVEIGEDSYLGPFVESQFSYSYLPQSAISVNLRYGTEPSGISNLAIRQTFRAWASIDHAFTGRLSGNAAIYFQNDNFDQPGEVNDFSQNVITGALGLRYRIGPAFAVFGRYEYSTVQSDIESSEYARNVTSIGIELIY